DRRWPLLLAVTCYTMTSVLFFRKPYFDGDFFVVMALVTVTVFLTLVINQFWKISAHGVGVGGALGILLLLHGWLPEPFMLFPILFTVVAGGAVLSARLALGAHTMKEVYVGFGLGFLVGISLWGWAF